LLAFFQLSSENGIALFLGGFHFLLGESTMPKSFGGLFTWVIGTVILVAVGVAILSRIPPLWMIINARGV